MAYIKIENLSVGYDGISVCDNLDFTINKGDYLCILGENGTGKSTLMKSILGILKPLSGKILFTNDVSKKEIGYLTQQNEFQKDFPATIKEIVMSGLQNRSTFRPFYTKSEKETANIAMKKLSIFEMRNHSFRELSGGQQQRVLLARALCSAGKILFLDEPVSGLDQNVSHELYNIIEDLNKNNHTSIVMVSHDVKHAVNYASHILQIGSKPFFGTKEEYLKNDASSLFSEELGGIL